MIRRRRWAANVVAWAAVAVLRCSPAAAEQATDPVEASIRALRRAVTPQHDGRHLPLLFALRQLRDQGLKSFFHQLAQREHWQLQVHAVLGLGEIDPERRIDPWLVTQISPQAQEAVIATGLDLELIGADQMKEILAWDDLHAMARLFMLAELVSLKDSVDQLDLVRLTKSEDHHIAGLSACLLAQLGEQSELAAFRTRLASLDGDDRVEVTIWLLEAIRRYHLTACQPWVMAVLDEPNVEADLAYRGAYTLLDLDVTAGLERWKRFLDKNPSYQQSVRYGMLLLATGANVPASAYDQLPIEDGEELLRCIVAAGKAISAGRSDDISTALIQLLDLDHMKSTEWLMGYLTDLAPEQASPVYAHVIDRVTSGKPQPGEAVALAVEATSKLFEINPELVLQRLGEAEDDSLLQQAILLGLFETASPKAGEAAASLRRIGSGRADSLALLLAAKHSPTLNPQDIEQLGKIAAGGGHVSEIVQIQAAWLYLKHTCQTETALAAIFK